MSVEEEATPKKTTERLVRPSNLVTSLSFPVFASFHRFSSPFLSLATSLASLSSLLHSSSLPSQLFHTMFSYRRATSSCLFLILHAFSSHSLYLLCP